MPLQLNPAKRSISLLFTASLIVTLAGCQTVALDASEQATQQANTPKQSTSPVNTASFEGQSAKDALRHEVTLDNGLKVIIKEDHRAPVVMTQIWYNVGSADEPKDKGGISHLLEHMMFKGTDKVSGTDFNRLITKFGGQHNAFTSYDYTGYYEMFPVNRLGLSLELEADRMTNLAFTSPEFQNEFVQERDVVMEERRLRTDSNPLARSYETFRQAALPDSPKGRSVIGPMAQIQAIDIDDLQAWYSQWYAPNNATLVIVGDVTPEATIAQVKQYFGAIKPKQIPPRPSVAQQGLQGYKQLTVSENVNVPTLMMAFNVPTLPSLTTQHKDGDDAYDLLMLQFVLDGGAASRFEKSLVREQGLLSSIGASYDAYERGNGLFLIQATPREGVSLQQAQTAILAEIDKLKSAAVSPQEHSRARNAIVTSMVFSQDSVAGQAQLIGSMQANGLDDRLIEQLADNIKQVSSQDINTVAKKYMVKDNLTVMYIEPKHIEPKHIEPKVTP